MKRQILSLLPALILLFLAAPAGASVIYVSGDQTGTWSADSVIVTGEVRVPPGQSLTILPGVEVLFSVYCKLIVDSGATLRAIGTPADSIRFDVLPPNVNWHGIRFLSASDSSRLEYCLLKHGRATGGGEDNFGGAIYCNNSSPMIWNNKIYENQVIQSGSGSTKGGGIYCGNNSNANISHNEVSGNTTSGISGLGGGIYCGNSNLVISENVITGNRIWGWVAGGGGGIYCEGGSPTISGNTISGNSVVGDEMALGGGIYCNNSNAIICSNTIAGNSAGYYGGGGIYCTDGNPTISSNTISGNIAWCGGGILCNSNPTISYNIISENRADGGGGGITCEYHANPIINGNTIVGNSAGIFRGGGISLNVGTLINSVIWGNTPDQIIGGLTVTYSDVQGGYAGTGNINAYPAFVDTAQDDYRLQWGSPCIDVGDPNPIYNDPDLTRADMGACYYDQSVPVRVLLTPYNVPIEIPATGGSFQYTLRATNIGAAILPTQIWCNVTLPAGNIYGPILGPVTVPVGYGQTLSRTRTQIVPASAPAGIYHYNAFAVAMGDTSSDSFTFTKAGGGGGDGLSGWSNTGDDLDGEIPALGGLPLQQPTFALYGAYPNPFNPSTVISYELPAASFVKLSVYDVSGRLVTRLVDGWREAGSHEVTFDGSALPSGIYFARFEAGDYSKIQKMVLMK